MRTNGWMRIYTMEDGGANEWGEPSQGERTLWGEVPCMIETVNSTRMGKYEDGEFRMASYRVTLEGRKRDFPFWSRSMGEVELERFGKGLGVYRISQAFRILSFNRIMVIV